MDSVDALVCACVRLCVLRVAGGRAGKKEKMGGAVLNNVERQIADCQLVKHEGYNGFRFPVA